MGMGTLHADIFTWIKVIEVEGGGVGMHWLLDCEIKMMCILV